MSEMRPDHSSGETPHEDREPPDSDTPRFGPTDRAPDTLPPPSWEPGIVEVQFREGVRPGIVTAGAEEAPAEIRSAEDIELTEVNRILRQYELQSAESTFQKREDLLRSIATKPTSVEGSARRCAHGIPPTFNAQSFAAK
jgi:hypothetical protein